MTAIYQQVQKFVNDKVERLLSMPYEGPVKADLANMRRGVGRAPGDMPELWGILFKDMPEEMLSKAGAPSYAEWAAYTALTLFALHQQSNDTKKKPMSVKGQSLGKAARQLVPIGDDDAEKRVLRRFNSVATAVDMVELAYYLRGIVKLLRNQNIALDYPALAGDLFLYQFPERAPEVRLSWGQDFYYIKKEETKDDASGKEDENDQ